MMGVRIVAFGVGLLLVIACSQASPAALSRTAQEHLKLDRFDAVTSIRGLPLGVRSGLQTLFASQEYDVQRDIAEPGARFQGTDAVRDSKLPLRRLIAAECSIDHCLVLYERGGTALTSHVALFHWTPEATRFESGGLAPRPLATIDDARKALLAGSLKESAKVW
jgi:hypothetical protein